MTTAASFFSSTFGGGVRVRVCRGKETIWVFQICLRLPHDHLHRRFLANLGFCPRDAQSKPTVLERSIYAKCVG